MRTFGRKPTGWPLWYQDGRVDWGPAQMRENGCPPSRLIESSMGCRMVIGSAGEDGEDDI